MNLGDKTATNEGLHIAYGSVMQRLYHEDNLLAQRVYNFLTVSAFLGAIAAIFLTGRSTTMSRTVTGVLAGFGSLLSLLQIAFGWRCYVAILFWRNYAWMLETTLHMPIDQLLFQFYKEGSVTTPWGRIVTRTGDGLPIYTRFPWTLVPSTNLLVGVGLPFLVGIVWVALLFALASQLYPIWLRGLTLAVLSVLSLCLLCFATGHPKVAIPEIERGSGRLSAADNGSEVNPPC